MFDFEYLEMMKRRRAAKIVTTAIVGNRNCLAFFTRFLKFFFSFFFVIFTIFFCFLYKWIAGYHNVLKRIRRESKKTLKKKMFRKIGKRISFRKKEMSHLFSFGAPNIWYLILHMVAYSHRI